LASGMTTAWQAVVIPDANVKHLMLNREVREAVAAGKFRIFSVGHVNECMAILTGLDAGERDAEGNFPEATVNYLIVQRLEAMADIRIALARSAEETDDEDED